MSDIKFSLEKIRDVIKSGNYSSEFQTQNFNSEKSSFSGNLIEGIVWKIVFVLNGVECDIFLSKEEFEKFSGEKSY